MAFLTRGVCLPWIFRVSWQTNHQPAHVHYDMSANLALRFFIRLHLLHACAAWPEQLKRAPRQVLPSALSPTMVQHLSNRDKALLCFKSTPFIVWAAIATCSLSAQLQGARHCSWHARLNWKLSGDAVHAHGEFGLAGCWGHPGARPAVQPRIPGLALGPVKRGGVQ